MSNDKDFKVKNGIQPASYQESLGTIATGSVTVGYDLSVAAYDSVSFSVSGQDTNPFALFMSGDGLKMYMLGNSTDTIYQYTLSTAFDLSTASYDSVSFSVAGQDTDPSALAFNNDGTKMYMVGYTSDSVHQYSLTTAYDLSTASYDSVSFSVASQDSTSRSLAFNNDGTKMYILGDSTNTIYQYSTGSTLTTNTLDLSTGSVFEITPTSNIQVGLSNPAASGTVSQATLLLDGVAEGYDLSGAAYDSVSFSVGSQEATPTGVTFNTDGTKMFICGSNGDEVNEYALSTPFDISTASFTTNFSVSAQEITPEDIVFKPDGTKMYIIGRTGDDIGQYSLSTAYDISTASFDSVTFSVSAQAAFPTGMRFNNDGTKIFICDMNNDSLFQYSLSTAYDISTASYDSVSYDLSAQFVSPTAISLNGDGTKMFAIGANTRLMYQYSLSTAFDLSSISYDSVTFALENSGGDPAGMTFNSDGTKMYVADYNTDLVYQYTTGSAYTVTYDSAIQFGGGTAPDSPLANERDVLAFSTRDGGTSYQAMQAIDGAK